ncbi:MAG: helix-turn-helix domain-containing protein [Verrucomicrobia bacterium]|nr:helix-turn-helix domain-containing protein [Verrucomicrobiota bacterium]
MKGYVNFIAPGSLSFVSIIEQSFKAHWHKLGGVPIHIIRDSAKPLSNDPDCIGIVLPINNENILRSAVGLKIPIINISERLPPTDCAVNIRYDSDDIGTLAAHHLLEGGYTNFYFLEDRPAAFSESRLEGFSKALQAKGKRLTGTFCFKKRANMNPAHFLADEVEQMRTWIQSASPTAAILAANDLVALRFIRALRACEPDWVDSIALVGVDDDFSRTDDPAEAEPITSVLPNFSGLGVKAAEVLASIHNGNSHRKGSVIKVSGAKLIQRETTGGFSCQDVMLTRITRWITKEINAGRSPKVPEILARFPMSERTLCGKFQKFKGESMRDFIMQKRVQRAARLLYDSDLSISEIAQLCGFNKHADLTERFSKYMGQTPSDFRKQRITVETE